MSVEGKEISRLRVEVETLKMRLEESSQRSTVKEKVLKAGIAELEGLYGSLKKRMTEVREKGYEIKMLNALNEIVATASRYIDIKEILQPTLDAVVASTEELMRARGKKVSVTGGIFLQNNGRLVIAALMGIRPETLGCDGQVDTGVCLCGGALKTRKIAYAAHCLADPRRIAANLTGEVQDHSHVAIPLNSGDKTAGVMFLCISPAGYEPEAADNAIFTALGSYLGVHIEKARLYAMVKSLAVHDGLTGLYNHAEFDNFLRLELQRSLRHSRVFSLLMMDIDFFKKINDAYGHQFGDSVLKRLAEIITSNLRNFDIAGRYGGEEFCVLLPDTKADGAMVAAERLRAAVEAEQFDATGSVVEVTISVGVAAYPANAGTAAELSRVADAALYAAKEGGRNRVVKSVSTKETTA